MLQEYDLLLCIFHVPKSQNMQQLRNATRIWFTTVYISCFWWYFLLSSNHSGHQVRLAAVKPNLVFHINYFTSDCCFMLGTRNKGLMLQTNTHYLCCGSHCHRLVLFPFCLELASVFDPQITVFALVFLLFLILSDAFWSDFFLSFLINSFSRSIYISLREKYPNTEFFLVRIFLYSEWIRRDLRSKTPYLVRIQENMDQ